MEFKIFQSTPSFIRIQNIQVFTRLHRIARQDNPHIQVWLGHSGKLSMQVNQFLDLRLRPDPTGIRLRPYPFVALCGEKQNGHNWELQWEVEWWIGWFFIISVWMQTNYWDGPDKSVSTGTVPLLFVACNI